ncbi:Ig-like domain-containing protein [Pyxidicoccus sp. 3LFB2]
MPFRKWLLCSLVVVYAGCEPVQVDSAVRELPTAQAEAERLVAARGFDLREVSLVQARDERGNRHELHFQGVPIWGLEAKTAHGVTLFPQVRFEPAAAVDTQPRVPQARAEAVALTGLKDASGRVEQGQLVLLPREERRLKPDAPASERPNAEHFERVVTGLTLIYRLELSTGEPDSAGHRRWRAEVDARSGALLWLGPLEVHAFPLPGTFRNVTGRGRYAGTFTFSTRFDTDDSTYWLSDPRGNTYLATFVGESKVITYGDYYSADASFGDGNFFAFNAAPDSVNGETAAVDAVHAVSLTWAFFETILGRNGPAGNGTPFLVRVHYPLNNATYTPQPRVPSIQLGYRVHPLSSGVMKPLTTTDVVAHELGHDFFMRELAGDPTLFSTTRSEQAGMNEGTGDIIGFMTELGRDAVRLRRTWSDLDTVTPRDSNFTLGEETGLSFRNFRSPLYDEWFRDIGSVETHEAGGPLARMFVLLAYGCAPGACHRVPNGFSGVGPTKAARIWGKAVELLPLGTDYVGARQAALAAATALEGFHGGPLKKATAFAFAAINVGFPPDTTPPQATLTCLQSQLDLECTGTISDAETPNQFHTPPQLVVDGGAQTHTLTGWQFTQRISGAALATGSHTVQLRAWDVWNNEVTRTVTVFLDKAGPTASVSRSGPPKQPLLTVTANDPSGVAMVEFLNGAQVLGTVFAPPYQQGLDTSTWTDGTSNLVIKVYDAYFNVTSLGHALKVDNTRPSVTMTVGTGNPPFSVNASVSDASTITRVDFKVDGLVFATRTNSATSYQASYSPLDALAHNLSVEVTDSFGNKGVAMQAAPRDLQPPTVSLNTSQLGIQVTLTVGVSDTCGLTYPYALYVDANLVAQPTTPDYVLTFGTSMTPGVHTFQALVRDSCGNTANFQTVFTKHLSPPVITGIARDDSQPKKPKFTVQCADAEGVNHVEMRENGVIVQSDNTAPYQFEVDTSNRADGDYTVLFHCSDNYGAASSPETRTVTADNTGPGFQFSIFGAGHSYLVSAGNVTDPHGVQSVRMTGLLAFDFTLTQPPFSAQWTFSWNTDSNWPMSVTAKDTWGNERTQAYWCYVDTDTTQLAYLNCQADPG